MHMTTRILLDYRKITSHREIARINWVIQVCLTQQEYQESLIQGKIRSQQNWNEGLDYS